MTAIAEGRKRRLEAAHDERAWLAWHTAVIGRVKKVPKLKDMQSGRRRRKRVEPQPWEKMLAVAQQWDNAVNRRQNGRQ